MQAKQTLIPALSFINFFYLILNLDLNLVNMLSASLCLGARNIVWAFSTQSEASEHIEIDGVCFNNGNFY